MPQTLNSATSLTIKLKESFQTPGATQGNLDLTFLPYIPLIDNRNKKIKA